ncbi:hypothetical protein D9619_011746 [Psilocybe cf. subviscida]|uniref:NACHT domain-containing protein n=1 Tax=Psilocybe cf. subviscida TaxID=2480587 RepID=A0A8H5B197_9AGAR|nr:hypothetical protein D9619_011746 [Psilocybe cf. subviscida]
MSFLPHKKTVRDHGAEGQSNLKPIMVTALRATEMALDGLPIPAAKTCISLVLKVIEVSDIAADNKKALEGLDARYQDLKEFLLSISTNIPKTVRQVVHELDLKLKRLAEQWEPRLTKKPRKRDIVLRLITASEDRDMLQRFVTETDQAISTFLLHFEVKSWIEIYTEIVKTRQATVLALLARAQSAAYNSLRADRAEPCMGGTRQTVVKTIDGWALNSDFNRPPMFWLNGLAGIGKTTIAHTVATLMDEKHQLGGSFFFLHSDEYRKDARLVFPTLAVQLSEIDPIVKTRLAEVLENDPRCVNEFATQFDKLILHPMSGVSLSKPLVIVLDALDECQPISSTTEILQILVGNIKRIPFLRVFITSRPEVHIGKGFSVVGGESVYQKLVLHKNKEVQEEVKGDVRLYLKTSLQKIWNRDNSGQWPPDRDLETLVEHSGKLFEYAATIERFIGGNPTLDPQRQLKLLLSVKVGHDPLSKSTGRLDQLYLDILDTAIKATEIPYDSYYLERFQKVVGSIVLMLQPLTLEALARFLGNYDIAEIRRTLYHLHSIIVVPDDPWDMLHTYHLSFPNFITSAKRCTNREAYINPEEQHPYLFLRCLDVMRRFFGSATRRRNIPHDMGSHDNQTALATIDQLSHKLRDNAVNSSVDEFFEGDIPMTAEVQYASDHWCSHLINIHVNLVSTETLVQVTNALEQFINYYLSQWVRPRIAQISLTRKTANLLQDTFDIMYSAHSWTAANVDPRRSQRTKKMLEITARDAFAHFFPQAADTGSYTLGHHVDIFLLVLEQEYVKQEQEYVRQEEEYRKLEEEYQRIEEEYHRQEVEYQRLEGEERRLAEGYTRLDEEYASLLEEHARLSREYAGLEGHPGQIEDKERQMEEQGRRIDEKGRQIEEHNRQMDEHSRQLEKQHGQLNEQSGRLNEQSGRLNEQNGRLNEQNGRLRKQQGQMAEQAQAMRAKPGRSGRGQEEGKG